MLKIDVFELFSHRRRKWYDTSQKHWPQRLRKFSPSQTLLPSQSSLLLVKDTCYCVMAVVLWTETFGLCGSVPSLLASGFIILPQVLNLKGFQMHSFLFSVAHYLKCFSRQCFWETVQILFFLPEDVSYVLFKEKKNNTCSLLVYISFYRVLGPLVLLFEAVSCPSLSSLFLGLRVFIENFFFSL